MIYIPKGMTVPAIVKKVRGCRDPYDFYFETGCYHFDGYGFKIQSALQGIDFMDKNMQGKRIPMSTCFIPSGKDRHTKGQRRGAVLYLKQLGQVFLLRKFRAMARRTFCCSVS